MGSFTEVGLSFFFADSTPPQVLAAFSAVASAEQHESAPPLPPPAVEAWAEWQPDWRTAGYPEGEGDPFVDEPWRHDWATVIRWDMSPKTAPHASLTWLPSMKRWSLDCRFSWKTEPEDVGETLAWLAPFVDPDDGDRKVFVGWALSDYDERPCLFWAYRGQWEVENLNPPDMGY